MTNSLHWIPVALYLAGWLAEFLRHGSRLGDRLRWSRMVLGVGWGAHTLLLVSLALEQGASLPVLLNAAGWLAILGYYALMQRRASAVIPFVIPPLAVALLITAFFTSQEGLAEGAGLGLSAAASRNVLTAHIISALAGTLLFGLACLVSVLYLLQERRLKAKDLALAGSRLPSLAKLEDYNHRAITLGFFFMTLGLLLGLVVAGLNTLPHRMFSLRQLIPTGVWLVYAVFLVSHDLRGRRGRFGAVWSIVGFAVVVSALVAEIVVLTSRT